MGKLVKCIMGNCSKNTRNTEHKICSDCFCGKPSGKGKCRRNPAKCRHATSPQNKRKQNKTTVLSKYEGKNGGVRSGVVYAIAHPKFGGWIKFGRFKDPGKAILSRYNVYCPFKGFNLVEQEWVSSRQKAEKELKLELKKVVKTPPNGEWFKITQPQAKKVLAKIGKKF